MAFLWRNLQDAVTSCFAGGKSGRYEPQENDEEPTSTDNKTEPISTGTPATPTPTAHHTARSGDGGIDSSLGEEEERALTPLQVLQHLPERIIVKLSSSTSSTSWSTSASNKPLVTFFFEWSTRVADLERLIGSSNNSTPRGDGAAASSSSGTAKTMISVDYGLDAKAALRMKQVFLDPSAGGVLFAELVGCDNVFPGWVADQMDDSQNGDFYSFRLSCVRHQRRHVLTLRIRKVRSNTTTDVNADDGGGGGGGVRFALDPASALLKVEIES